MILHGAIFFKLNECRKPEWRALYKPPLIKKTGDFILHGSVAVNSFISILNPEVSAECPFCNVRETIFHAFVNCNRLEPLFLVLRNIFSSCNETFSMDLFILGFKYVLRKRSVCQLLNFVLGQAKLAIYLSRKKKVDQNVEQNIVVLF